MNVIRTLAALGVVTALTLVSLPAEASCRITNTTSHSFKVRSGNTSNQTVSGNTNTSIADGDIVAESDDGRKVEGHCDSGDEIKIVEKNGKLEIVDD